MMKKLILSLLICTALASCSEQMNENGHVIKVDIEDARPMELLGASAEQCQGC